jgi:hypothetical protein
MSDLMVRSHGAAEPVTAVDEVAAREWARRIELVVQSLQSRFSSTVDESRIRAEVEAGFAAYSAAPVREFIPILVESRVRSHLLRQSTS